MAGKKVRVHMEKSSEAHVRFPFFFSVYQNTKRLQRGNGVVSIVFLFGFPKSTMVDLVRLYFSWDRKKD